MLRKIALRTPIVFLMIKERDALENVLQNQQSPEKTAERKVNAGCPGNARLSHIGRLRKTNAEIILDPIISLRILPEHAAALPEMEFSEQLAI